MHIARRRSLFPSKQLQLSSQILMTLNIFWSITWFFFFSGSFGAERMQWIWRTTLRDDPLWGHIINTGGETASSLGRCKETEQQRVGRRFESFSQKGLELYILQADLWALNIISSNTPGYCTCSSLPAPESAFNTGSLLLIYSHDKWRAFKTLCLILLNVTNQIYLYRRKKNTNWPRLAFLFYLYLPLHFRGYYN